MTEQERKAHNAAALQVIATTEERAVYQRIKRFLARNKKAIITRGHLRLEAVGGATTSYRFNVVRDEGAGTQRPSEVRLGRTDAFFVDQMGFFIAKRLLGDTPEPFGAPDLHAFANGAVFGGTTELPAARTLLNNGRVALEVDAVKYLAQLDTLGSRFVGAAQELLDAGGGEGYDASSWDREKVMRRMTPTLRLNGGSDNVLTWNTGDRVNFAGQNVGEVPSENVLVVIAYGWHAQNAGEFEPSRRI